MTKQIKESIKFHLPLYLLQNNIRINLWHYRNAHDSSEVSHSSPISLLNCTFLSSDWLCGNQNFVERKTGDLKTAEEENQKLTNNKIKMMVFKYHSTAQRESENVDRCFVFSKKVLRSGKIQIFLFLPIYQSLDHGKLNLSFVRSLNYGWLTRGRTGKFNE